MDSSDHERLPEARRELQNVLSDREMRGVPVLIVANKQDLPGKIYSGTSMAQTPLEP